MIENCEYTIIKNSSDDLCTLGHVGGLCEGCDLYNLRG
jgi:hypothetical protein